MFLCVLSCFRVFFFFCSFSPLPVPFLLPKERVDRKYFVLPHLRRTRQKSNLNAPKTYLTVIPSFLALVLHTFNEITGGVVGTYLV